MPAIDVSALVGDIPAETVTIRTPGTPTIDAFGQASSTYTDVGRDCVVHPSGRRTVEKLAAVARGRQLISIYSTDALQDIGGRNPARVIYQGREYEIVDLGDYATLGGIYLAHAALIDEVA